VIRLISWPYLRRHVLRTTLMTASIALGVAVFVGMHTANETVRLAFAETVDRIAGRTELQVTAGDAAFGEDVLERVQSARTVRVAVPVIEAVVDSHLPGQGSLLVLGIDMTGDRSLRDMDLEAGDDAIIDDPLVFLAQPDSLILTKEFADRNGIAPGSRLPLATAVGERAFTVRGIMKATGLATAFGGNIALMDVYAAQHMFGRGRTFDRIDLAVTPGTTLAECQRELGALLGPGFEIQPPSARGQQFEAMLAGYSLMVNLSSVFALVIGLLIIYNAFATAVTERRAEIGILRALGATQGRIRAIFLCESALLGAVGSAAGLVVGLLAARLIGSAVGGLLAGVYGVPRYADGLAIDPMLLALAFAAGVGASLLAAAVPAAAAARVDAVRALQKGTYQVLPAGEHRARAVLAAGLAALAVLFLAIPGSRPLAYAGYLLSLGAALLLVPLLSLGVARALRPILAWLRPVEGALAADSLLQAPRRLASGVGALMLSLALVVAFSGMSRASYDSIVGWMDGALDSDLFVLPSQSLDIRTARFPATMGPQLAGLPGIGRVQMQRNTRMTLADRTVMVIAIEAASVAETDRRRPVAGDSGEMYARLAAGEGLVVSDTLAQVQGLALGDVLEVPAPYGLIRLPIVGILVDYSDPRGSILMDRRLFVRHWRDDSVSAFRVFAAPGAAVTEVRQQILERYAAERRLFVLTNDQLKGYMLEILDQWFGLTIVQIAVAVFVAIFGIVNTLTVSITDRRRELGVLQAIGGLRRQIRRTIWIEAVAVGAIGLVLGCALGALNLHYMLQIVHRDVDGMRLAYQFPVATSLALVPVILGTAFVAALWPAESAVRGNLVEALEYE
jgi:putative ABC transport system permease protein